MLDLSGETFLSSSREEYSLFGADKCTMARLERLIIAELHLVDSIQLFQKSDSTTTAPAGLALFCCYFIFEFKLILRSDSEL